MEDLFLLLLVGLICRDGLLTVEASEIPLPKGGIWDVRQRYRRQAMRGGGGAMPPMNEANAEREGVFDPAFLAAMFQASGFLPSMGSSMMNNGFSSLCTYPYLYYYYQYCVGMGSNVNSLQPDIFPYSVNSNSPGLMPSSSNNYPLYTSNGMDGLGPYTNLNPQTYMNPYAFSPGSSPSEQSPRIPERTRERPPPVIPSPNPSFASRTNHVPRGSPMRINNPIMGYIPPAFAHMPMGFPSIRPSPRGAFRIPPSVIFAKMFGPLLEKRGPDVTMSTRTLNSNSTVTAVMVEVGDVNGASVSIESPIIEVMDNVPLPSVIDIPLRPTHDKKPWTKMVTRLNQKGNWIKNEKEFEKFLKEAFETLTSVENTSLSQSTELNTTKAFTVIMDAIINSTKAKDGSCVKQYFCHVGKQLLRDGGHFDPGLRVLQAIRPSISSFLESRTPDAEIQLSTAMEEAATSRSCDILKQC